MSADSRKAKLEEMLKEFPEDAFLHYGLAMEHVSAGEFDTAVQVFRTLIGIDPNYVPAYMQAGQVLTRLGRDEDARDIFRSGIEAARRANDLHALQELTGFLDSM